MQMHFCLKYLNEVMLIVGIKFGQLALAIETLGVENYFNLQPVRRN
jgi:hypothetical protein